MNPLDPQMRIADSDRERAMADLATHYADGRLEHEEYDERLDAVWTAKTRGDLALLFDDLPRPVVTYAPVAKPASQRGSRRARLPLLPVFALLVALSIILGTPLWLLIFPLMFFRSRHGGTHAPHGVALRHGGYVRR